MSEKNIGEKTLADIKRKKLKPKAKWGFLLKDLFLWIFLLIFLVFGGLSMSVIFYFFNHTEWELYRQINQSIWHQAWVLLPYFWILALAFFVLVVTYKFKNSNEGYKFRLSLVLVLIILCSSLLGLFFYSLNLGGIVDEKMSSKIPAYYLLNNCEYRQRAWCQPEKGFLAGLVYDLNSEEFKLLDNKNQDWLINAQGAQVSPRVNIVEGESIRIKGEILDLGHFKAREIKRGIPGCSSDNIAEFSRPKRQNNFTDN